MSASLKTSRSMQDETGGLVEAVSVGHIHHERQSYQLCGLHALNALVQKESKPATVEEMDDTADEILQVTIAAGAGGCCVRWCPLCCVRECCHPHRNAFGNYDVNVITSVLEKRSFEVSWYDNRKLAREIDFEDASLVGFLVNGPNSHFGIRTGRHWFAIRRVGEKWFNLDSMERRPKLIPDIPLVRDYLQRELDDEGQLLLVRRKEQPPPTAEKS